jgi:hypothetical protein
MSPNQDLERIARKIDREAGNAGRALAESFAANFTGVLEEIALEQRRVVEHMFVHVACDALKKFPTLKYKDKLRLRNRAIAAIKTAFTKRLAKLDGVLH